jgi:ATP-binding cassette subfamily B protein
MLKNGTIYLLDEPTTGLDGLVAKQIQATLDSLSANVTTIMITHHLEDLKHAHAILYLDSGKIVERGTYDSLLASGGKFAEQVEARKR